MRKLYDWLYVNVFDRIVCKFLCYAFLSKEGIIVVWGLFILILAAASGSHHGADID